jgi:hypothetical protein
VKSLNTKNDVLKKLSQELAADPRVEKGFFVGKDFVDKIYQSKD